MTGEVPPSRPRVRPWVRICRASAVPVNAPLGVKIEDDGGELRHFCVAQRSDGSFVAMLDRCPHRDVALSGGVISDDLLTCPGHFWRFSLVTGKRTDLPSEVATLYPTRVADGWVEVELPEKPPRLSMREWLLQQARGPG
jgi:nitrite reductase (NADH) small subunit